MGGRVGLGLRERPYIGRFSDNQTPCRAESKVGRAENVMGCQ